MPQVMKMQIRDRQFAAGIRKEFGNGLLVDREDAAILGLRLSLDDGPSLLKQGDGFIVPGFHSGVFTVADDNELLLFVYVFPSNPADFPPSHCGGDSKEDCIRVGLLYSLHNPPDFVLCRSTFPFPSAAHKAQIGQFGAGLADDVGEVIPGVPEYRSELGNIHIDGVQPRTLCPSSRGEVDQVFDGELCGLVLSEMPFNRSKLVVLVAGVEDGAGVIPEFSVFPDENGNGGFLPRNRLAVIYLGLDLPGEFLGLSFRAKGLAYRMPLSADQAPPAIFNLEYRRHHSPLIPYRARITALSKWNDTLVEECKAKVLF